MDQETAKSIVRHSCSLSIDDLGLTSTDNSLYLRHRFGLIWLGALYLFCESASRGGRIEKAEAGSALFRIEPGREPERVDLTGEQLLALQQSSISPAADGWVLVQSNTMITALDSVRVRFLPARGMGFGPLCDIAVEHDLPVFRKSADTQPFFRRLSQETGRVLHGGAAEGSHIVPVPFKTAAHVCSIVFLRLSPDFQTAAWHNWPIALHVSFPDRVKRFFRPAEMQRLSLDDLLSLDMADYPHDAGFETQPVPVLEAATDGQRVFVFSRGPKESIKYGAFGTVLAEIGVDGTVVRSIVHEDFTQGALAPRNNARTGCFVDGGRSFVMRSGFASTDPWKGAWVQVSLANGARNVLTPPRNCKGMHVLDLDKQGGWYGREEPAGSLTIWRLE